MYLNGFKQFFEDMDQTPEKMKNAASDKQDYFAALGDEEGMEWKDIVKVFQNEPFVSTHFSLGDLKYKMSPWKIVPGTMTPNGADIELKMQKGNRSYLDGNRLNKSKYKDTKRYHLNREELQKFLTTGWTPAVQGGAAGGTAPIM